MHFYLLFLNISPLSLTEEADIVKVPEIVIEGDGSTGGPGTREEKYKDINQLSVSSEGNLALYAVRESAACGCFFS